MSAPWQAAQCAAYSGLACAVAKRTSDGSAATASGAVASSRYCRRSVRRWISATITRPITTTAASGSAHFVMFNRFKFFGCIDYALL